nr:roadblock/LC7 domain-containing protein [Candidatus Sigynarchaeum springense]
MEKKTDPHRKLTDILEEINKRGNFRASVFATDEGLVLSSNRNPQVSEAKVGAMATLLAESAHRAEAEVEMKAFKYLKIAYGNGIIMCRALDVQGKTFLLAVLADPPANDEYAKYYDQLLDWAGDNGRDALVELLTL